MIRQYIVHDDYADVIRVEGMDSGNVSIEFIVGDDESRVMVLTAAQQDELLDAIGHASFDAGQLKEEFQRSVAT